MFDPEAWIGLVKGQSSVGKHCPGLSVGWAGRDSGIHEVVKGLGECQGLLRRHMVSRLCYRQGVAQGDGSIWGSMGTWNGKTGWKCWD